MRCHIQKTVANCFGVLRQLRSIRRSVPTPLVMLFVALVLSRLDYGNAVLVHWLPAYLYNCLQSERVQFKLATIAYRSLNGTAPHYTWLLICTVRLTCRPDDVCDHHVTDQLDVRQSQCSSSTVGDRSFAVAGARLWNSLPLDVFAYATRCNGSVENSKHFYSDSHMAYPSILFKFFFVVLAVFT